MGMIKVVTCMQWMCSNWVYQSTCVAKILWRVSKLLIVNSKQKNCNAIGTQSCILQHPIAIKLLLTSHQSCAFFIYYRFQVAMESVQNSIYINIK